MQQLHGEINGPTDLPGKRVASVRASTSIEYLRQHNMDAVEYGKVEDAFQALEQGQIDAVVYDAPVLLYCASHQGKKKFQTVGTIFRKESYGIAFRRIARITSPLTKRYSSSKKTAPTINSTRNGLADRAPSCVFWCGLLILRPQRRSLDKRPSP